MEGQSISPEVSQAPVNQPKVDAAPAEADPEAGVVDSPGNAIAGLEQRTEDLAEEKAAEEFPTVPSAPERTSESSSSPTIAEDDNSSSVAPESKTSTPDSTKEDAKASESSQERSKTVHFAKSVLEDAKYKEIYEQVKSESGEAADAAKIQEEAVSRFYDQKAETAIDQGLPDEIKNDPAFKNEFNAVKKEFEKGGQNVHDWRVGKQIEVKALAQYSREKDFLAEVIKQSPESSLLADYLNGKIDKLQGIISEHAENTLKIAKLVEPLIKDEKGKASIREIIGKTLAIVAATAVKETFVGGSPLKEAA